VLVGLSSGTIDTEVAQTMAEGAIVFALSNPDPEITPAEAQTFASVIATGRSDFPNQINNVLAFPGIFRGALDSGAKRITSEMKLAAAAAIAELVGDELGAEYIVPSPLDPRVAPAVADAVARVAH
jgi:malate dehydrogenase (oxaloacetate-decarboxylating)